MDGRLDGWMDEWIKNAGLQEFFEKNKAAGTDECWWNVVAPLIDMNETDVTVWQELHLKIANQADRFFSLSPSLLVKFLIFN